MADTDRELITGAVLDYFEGWFDGDVARMDRALHPDLVKRWPGGTTSKARMLELTGNGEGAEDGKDRRLDVEIHDVHDDIATVTVRSAVYREYLHLLRTPEGWRIANTLWRYS
jgi:hypothetical protein